MTTATSSASGAGDRSKNLVKIGTRGSQLALIQANLVRDLIHQTRADLEIEIEIISTAGDRIQDRALSEVGGKGLFTFEIEERLKDGTLDLAVHSAKDMPTALPDGLELTCFPKREDPSDAFISRVAGSLEALPQNAVIGSASLRRGALIRRIRPDCEVVLFRGNVDTRLKKLDNGEVDATFLATAGLNRMGLAHEITKKMSLEHFPPAPAQGAICIETRKDNDRILNILAPINHFDTQTTVCAERHFLAGLDGSCKTPIAAHATIQDDQLYFHGMILSPDGTQLFETRSTGRMSEAAETGTEAAARLRAEAGTSFFETW